MLSRLISDKGVSEYVVAVKLLNLFIQMLFSAWQDPLIQILLQLADSKFLLKRQHLIEYLGDLHDVKQALASCSNKVLPSTI